MSKVIFDQGKLFVSITSEYQEPLVLSSRRTVAHWVQKSRGFNMRVVLPEECTYQLTMCYENEERDEIVLVDNQALYSDQVVPAPINVAGVQAFDHEIKLNVLSSKMSRKHFCFKIWGMIDNQKVVYGYSPSLWCVSKKKQIQARKPDANRKKRKKRSSTPNYLPLTYQPKHDVKDEEYVEEIEEVASQEPEFKMSRKQYDQIMERLDILELRRDITTVPEIWTQPAEIRGPEMFLGRRSAPVKAEESPLLMSSPPLRFNSGSFSNVPLVRNVGTDVYNALNNLIHYHEVSSHQEFKFQCSLIPNREAFGQLVASLNQCLNVEETV